MFLQHLICLRLNPTYDCQIQHIFKLRLSEENSIFASTPDSTPTSHHGRDTSERARSRQPRPYLSASSSPKTTPHTRCYPHARTPIMDVDRRPALQSTSSQSSTASSAYQSTSSLSSLSAPAHTFATSSAAPLPSPTVQQTSQQYFASIAQMQQTQPSSSTSRPALQQNPSFEYAPQRQGAGQTAPETANLLSQYNLVAEAAKRAQMAVLMRDMEGMDMS